MLVTGFMVLLFNSGQRFSMGLMLKPMAEDLDWTRSTLSLVVTVFLVLSALALPFAGRLVDRYGASVVLGISVLLAAVGIALMRWIETPLHAFVLYGVVFALGSAGTAITPVSVLISQWYPHRLGLANSVAISGMGVGQLAVVGLLAVWLATLGWRDAFLWLGIVSVVMVVPLLLIGTARLRPDGCPGGCGTCGGWCGECRGRAGASRADRDRPRFAKLWPRRRSGCCSRSTRCAASTISSWPPTSSPSL